VSIDDLLTQYAGTILTVGGSIGVAFIGGYAMVRARKASPGREPVPIQDIWVENRRAREEADRERAENIALERRVANQGSAIVVLWRYVQHLTGSWGQPEMPQLSREDRTVIDRVVEDVNTPPAGTPAVGPSTAPSS
jgi:hypothetical protein